MSVQVHIVDGPVETAASAPPAGAGAVVRFEGVVRGMEEDRAIVALDYEAYEPMASARLSGLATTAVQRFGLVAACVEHSRGRVPVGACSFRLTIYSAHRKEGLAAADWFIDAMKSDVAIWKQPVFLEQEAERA